MSEMREIKEINNTDQIDLLISHKNQWFDLEQIIKY
jgi:hypothetical protein